MTPTEVLDAAAQRLEELLAAPFLNPAVGRALALWLRAEAAHHRNLSELREGLNVQLREAGGDPARAWLRVSASTLGEALVVARAILDGTTTSVGIPLVIGGWTVGSDRHLAPRRVWTYRRDEWDPPWWNKLGVPSFGADEWGRRTIVVGLWLVGYVVWAWRTCWCREVTGDDRIRLVGGPCDGRMVPARGVEPMVQCGHDFSVTVTDRDGMGQDYRYDYDTATFVYAGPAEPSGTCWARLPAGHGWCYEPAGHPPPHRDCRGHEFTDIETARRCRQAGRS